MTISGLISQSIASKRTNASWSFPTIAAICFCSDGSVDAGAVDEPPRLPRVEALERVDVEPDERVGALLGDLLDVDAALRREHVERLLRAAVEREREVVLLRDLRGLLDPELADDVAADVEPEDLLRALLRLVRASRRA